MSTGTVIIKRALQKIGANSVVAPATPDSIVLGMEELNSMLGMWLSYGITIGFTPLRVPGDELSEPVDTTSGIISNLAIRLAPDFDNGKNVVSNELRNAARSQYNQIKDQYQVITIPAKVVSSTLPTGAGNQRGYRNRVFFPKGSTING